MGEQMFFFLMIRRPPRSTQSRSSAASDVYKRQRVSKIAVKPRLQPELFLYSFPVRVYFENTDAGGAVSYTHLRAHETVLDLVCRLLLEKKNNKI